jgi:DNA-binding MarR family transcriptional regulator
MAAATGRRRRARPAAGSEQIAVSAWLRLLRVRALIEREVRRGLGDRLTLPQFDVLNQLARSRDGMTFVALSRLLLVTAGNLTGIVDRLEALGLVRRAPQPGDRRAIRLTLTARGRVLVRARVPAHRRAVARLLATLPRREVRALRTLLGRLRDRLEARLTGGGGRAIV